MRCYAFYLSGSRSDSLRINRFCRTSQDKYSLSGYNCSLICLAFEGENQYEQEEDRALASFGVTGSKC